MAGGPGNPLGARAMYLSGSVYRIHGTNKPSSIGQHVSSGCIRMLNEDVIDLYARTQIGTKVVVLPTSHHQIAMVSVPSATNGSTNNLRWTR
jgi:lipoprotein-anchoring transpeptidase ErfK/SrfK